MLREIPCAMPTPFTVSHRSGKFSELGKYEYFKTVFSRSDHLSRKSTHKFLDNPNLFAIELTEKLSPPWIENTFEKRECIRFAALPKDPERCGCGRPLSAHTPASTFFSTLPVHLLEKEQQTWTIANNTQTSTTDAFGTIVFQGGAHAHKAQYVRLSYDSEPLDVMYLMEKVWGLEAPRLVITVHGGMSNFEWVSWQKMLFRLPGLVRIYSKSFFENKFRW